ncbi:MAG: Gfo/Idh/MocA family oxidoreductase [Acidimicrobiia bacterium]|nr:Gfo/Idh/MocA family oxidoreductase [Acidimicrobiia bacterium]
MSKKKCLMVGAGGFAGVWVRHFLPVFRDRLSVVGLVDVNRQLLDQAADFLELAPTQRFADLSEAFARTDADFCILAIPPVYNKQAVSMAVERGMPVLCEKPIADSWQACLDIFRMVKQADLKMAIVQNYRFTSPILTLKRAVQQGDLGSIIYITSRFAVDHLQNVGGRFRYDIPDIMLYEASVHHFDQLRNLSGADCAWITGKAWNPPGSGFDTDCCGLFIMEMTNGVKCQYETSYIAADIQNDWHREYYRVACEKGSVIVDRDSTVRVVEHLSHGRTKVTEVEQVSTAYEGHHAMIDQFLTWLDDGPAPQTEIADNIRTDAICFAAAEASREGRVIDVSLKLQSAGLLEIGLPAGNVLQA